MLVLSRLRDEEIYIGDSIRVSVVDIRGDKVRLGIDAPRGVPVHRSEVRDRIIAEGKRTDDCASVWFARLEDARASSDIAAGAEAIRELRRHGYIVTFEEVVTT